MNEYRVKCLRNVAHLLYLGITYLVIADIESSENLLFLARNSIKWIIINVSFAFHRDNSPSRTLFTERLVEDRVESAFSYYEFLQHVKNQVK